MPEVYPDYVAFIEDFVLPTKLVHPNCIRLDGRQAGDPTPKARSGIVAYLIHDGDRYQVDADARIDNLVGAYEAWKNGKVAYPVVVVPSRAGKKKLAPSPGAGSAKGFFIYNPAPFSPENSVIVDHEVSTLDADDPGQVDAPVRDATTRGRRDDKFRRRVFRLWGARCVLSGCEEVGVLDAAHINAHSKTGDNRATNGIPLRSDLNRLMESGGLTFRIDGQALVAVIAAEITYKPYRQMNGKVIPIPIPS